MARWPRVLRRLARRWSRPVSPPEDLDVALGFLRVPVEAETVVRAANVLGLAVGTVSAFVGLALGLLFGAPVVGLALGGCLGLLTRLCCCRGPVWTATLVRTRALGAAPALVAVLALRLRLEPSPERAATFAARTAEGRLAASLDDHRREALATPRSGLGAFAAAWRPWLPELDRAASLLLASAADDADGRERGLDRALDVVLDGTRDRLADFAGDVRGPTAGAYAFGVVLPLALAGMLPAARVAGVDVGVIHVVVLYDLLLPAALFGAAGWLLLHRPVAFPAPHVPRTHPDVPGGSRRPLLAGFVGAVVAWTVATAVLPAWTGPVAAAGVGTGTALYVHAAPAKAVHDRVEAVEAGLDDALYLVGRRVSVGASVESAVDAAAEALDGATGEVLADAAGVRRRLRVGVGASFTGDHGVLTDLPSRRTRDVAAFLSLAAAEGRPAGPMLVGLAEQLAALRRIERDARRELGAITDTLTNTGTFFGPLVAGATVALAGRMASAVTAGAGAASAVGGGSAIQSGGAATAALPPGPLGLAVGTYALLLAATLTVLSTGLERGLAPTLVTYRLGVALPAATATFLAGYAGAAMLV
jgi:hypothetical protein